MVGDIAKTVHDPGGESGAEATTHLDAEGAAEGDKNAGSLNTGLPGAEIDGEAQHGKRH